MKNKKGFTLVEILAVIAILGILVVITTGNILKHIQRSKIGVMITNENEVLDITNVYLEDYCKHPLNSSYKCPSSYKYNSQKYICLKTLKNTSIGEKLVDDITFDDDNCNGIIIFDEDKPGKTYLFCGKKGNYSYVTDENVNIDDFDCSYDEETNYKREFIITYNSNTKSNVKFQRECLFGQPCSLSTNTFTNEGNHFIGWEDTNGVIYKEGESVQNKIKRDTNLYAKWEINTAIISYNANGGAHTGSNTAYTVGTDGKISKNNSPLKTTVKYGTPLAKDGLANPNSSTYLYLTKTGYHFEAKKEWYLEVNGTKKYYDDDLFDTYVANDFCNADNGNCSVTLYANFVPNTYTVTYNGNGSTSGSTASSTHTYGISSNLAKNSFMKAGYKFIGWNTKADGSGTTYANNASVSNLTTTNGGNVTLYAKWVQAGVKFSYTGKFSITEDLSDVKSNTTVTIEDSDWEIYLLSDGVLTFNDISSNADLFLVGGGGGGAGAAGYNSKAGCINYTGSSGGGGGGFFNTYLNKPLVINNSYSVVIGKGGEHGGCGMYGGSGSPGTKGGTTYFDKEGLNYSAAGGNGGEVGDSDVYNRIAGGGSGGTGGTNGGSGIYGNNTGKPGGAGIYKFNGTSGSVKYACGGDGGGVGEGKANTGNGGGGGTGSLGDYVHGEKYSPDLLYVNGSNSNGGNGGTGIVIIRNAR